MGHDLPGATCGPSPDRPVGHKNIHVAIRGRKGRQDLFGMTRADAESVTWEPVGEPVSAPPEVDLRGLRLHGAPSKRFNSVSWGTLDRGTLALFRRAKLWRNAVPLAVMAAATDKGCSSDVSAWPMPRAGRGALRCARR